MEGAKMEKVMLSQPMAGKTEHSSAVAYGLNIIYEE